MRKNSVKRKNTPEGQIEASAEPGRAESRSGIQSIEVGAPLLEVLAHAEDSMPLTALSAGAGMTASKAHRYLTSFIRVGLVEQDSDNGRYNLGPMARDVGLAALRRLDVVREAHRTMTALRDKLEENIVLSVWDEGAPAVVRVEENARALSVRVRLGARLPLLSSSTGQVYAAWMSPAIIAPYVEKELAVPDGPAAHIGLRSKQDVELMVAEVRRRGVSSVVSGVLEGISAVCAPVFRYPNTLAAALTVVGIGKLDTSIPGRVTDALRDAAAELSTRLGAEKSAPASALQESTNQTARHSKRHRDG
jgi:DNA-binding IclR family transcriptional regulator